MPWTGTFTFTGTLSSQLERVRNLLFDTDSSDVLAYDEQYGPFLTGGSMAQANDYLAAAMVAGLIARKFARQATSLSAGGTSVNWGARAKTYADLATSLRMQAARSSAKGPYVGGASLSGLDARHQDPDRTPEAFRRDTGDFAHRAASDADWDGR